MLVKQENKNKWDSLYDPNKKKFIAKLEEQVKKWHFDKVFENSILSISHVKNGKILEPGCGSATISLRLAKRGNDVTILDLSRNAILRALSIFDQENRSCSCTMGDLFHMPFKDGEFDLVFNQGVIEHFKLSGLDPSITIKEMLRVLGRNGSLIILAPAFLSPLHVVYSFLKFFNLVDKLWPFEKQEFLHKETLYKIMIDGGCENVVVKRLWSSFLFTLVAYSKKTGLDDFQLKKIPFQGLSNS